MRSTRLLYPCGLKNLHESVAHHSARETIGNPGNAHEADCVMTGKRNVQRKHTTRKSDLFFIIQQNKTSYYSEKSVKNNERFS